MNHLIPTPPEFGQPDHVYEGPASLIVAVNAFKNRFSPEAQELATQLTAQILTIEVDANMQAKNDHSDILDTES